MAEDQIRTEEIAPGGDLILVAGSREQVRLLVASANLKRSSAVFEALLSSKYREGQELGTSANPKEIELPEDEAQPMSNMLNLLHGRHTTFAATGMLGKQILELIVAIDKYACADALHYQTQAILMTWLDNDACPEEHCMGSLFNIVAASYLAHHPHAFRLATKCLVDSVSGDYASLLGGKCGEILPVSVFYAIERKRTAAYTKIATGLPHLDKTRHLSSFSARDGGFRELISDAFGVESWPPSFLDDETVSQATEIIRGLDITEAPEAEITPQELRDFADEVESLCSGLCLCCAQSGKADLLPKCADGEHKQKFFGQT